MGFTKPGARTARTVIRRLRGAMAALRGQPLDQPGREFVEKARHDVVPKLAVEHATLRMGEIEAPPRAGDRDIREPALLLDAVVFGQAVLVREKAFFEPRNEDRM